MEVTIPFVHANDVDRDIGVGDLHLAAVGVELFGPDGVFLCHFCFPLAFGLAFVAGIKPAFHEY